MRFHHLGAKSGDDGDVADAVRLQGFDLPFDQRPAVEVDHALGHVRGQRKQARALPCAQDDGLADRHESRSEEHTSELQSLMRISYAVFCLKKKNKQKLHTTHTRNSITSKN